MIEQNNAKKKEHSFSELLTLHELVSNGLHFLYEKHNPTLAFEKFQLAAMHEFEPAYHAICELAELCRKEGSHKISIMYYQVAAEDFNYSPAQFHLGKIYEGGIVPADDQKSLRFYRLAASQGHALAKRKLQIKYNQVAHAYIHSKGKQPFINNNLPEICQLTLHLKNNSIMLEQFNSLAEQYPEQIWSFFEKNPDDLWKVDSQNNQLDCTMQKLIKTDKAVYSLINAKIEILKLTRNLPFDLSILVVAYLYFQDDFERNARRYYYSSSVQTLFAKQRENDAQQNEAAEVKMTVLIKQNMKKEYGREARELTTFSCRK